MSITNIAPWQMTPPTEPGRWEMRCDETGQEPETVYVFNRDGELWVEDADLGRYPLSRYHDGLCLIQWHRCEPEEGDSWKRKAEIYEHALRLIANDKTNPEGWATDKQIADHYLQKGAMS